MPCLCAALQCSCTVYERFDAYIIVYSSKGDDEDEQSEEVYISEEEEEDEEEGDVESDDKGSEDGRKRLQVMMAIFP